jgi:hypothetical protein
LLQRSGIPSLLTNSPYVYGGCFLNKHLMIALLGWWGGGGNLPSTYFGAIRFFNAADTLESCSILIIYAELRAGLYTQ